MKRIKHPLIAFTLGCVFAQFAGAQGSLTPPGAPGATMKTLDQVEPRKPISSAPITISSPGSYFLTTNLTGRITIAADDVSLDLMGFSISPPSGSAIGLSAGGSPKNVRVSNGVLSAPTGNGIDFSTSVSNANGIIEGIRVRDCLYYGIAVKNGYEVRDCDITGAGFAGIRVNGNSTVRNNRITDCNKGLQFTGAGAMAEGNLVFDNIDNYDFTDGNHLNLLLSQVPESLDWPCSVKFAGTLICSATGTNGITVNADRVTIDMDGHALIGPGVGSGHGIYQGNRRNLTLLNGAVVQWRGANVYGVYASGEDNHLTGLQVSTNSYGIYLYRSSSLSDSTANQNLKIGIQGGANMLISRCTANANGSEGIIVSSGVVSHSMANENFATGIYLDLDGSVRNCTARNNTTYGIASSGTGVLIADCRALNNGATGIALFLSGAIKDCTAVGNGVSGFYLDGHISGCLATHNGSSGIELTSGQATHCTVMYNQRGMEVETKARVSDCTFVQNTSVGLLVTSGDNRIDNNTMEVNGVGINVTGTGNLITRNSAAGNGTNYVFVADNRYGPIISITAAGTAAVSGSSAASTVASTDPWANFAH